MKINVIGAGKLGQTLGYLIVKNQLGKIGGIYNRRQVNSSEAIQFIGQGECFSSLAQLPPADISFITTPDEAIAETAKALCRSPIKAGSLFVHCSGVLTSDVLSALKAHQAFIASIHPMRSFAKPSLAVEEYPGTFCAVEGDKEGLAILTPFFQSMGSVVHLINKEKKALYHASGVFASNYLITLAEQGSRCLQAVGIEKKQALSVIIDLMKGTLSNLQNLLSTEESLTGPIKRGDCETIKHHMSAFSNRDTALLYSTLGQATLPLSTHDKNTLEKLRACLLTPSD